MHLYVLIGKLYACKRQGLSVHEGLTKSWKRNECGLVKASKMKRANETRSSLGGRSEPEVTVEIVCPKAFAVAVV